MVQDSTFNITWLADRNDAKPSGQHADGAMDRHSAKTWHPRNPDWRGVAPGG
jgi:hypothetical protein